MLDSGDDIEYDNDDEVDETGKNSDAEPLPAQAKARKAYLKEIKSDKLFQPKNNAPPSQTLISQTLPTDFIKICA